MRSDYALYIVAAIFFAITSLSFALTLAEMERNLWIMTTVVLGLLFLGLGYIQRPKTQITKMEATPMSTTPTPTPVVTEVKKKETMEPVAEVTPSPKLDLTSVKGIKTKRTAQLKGLGINSVEELANASAEDIGSKLKISPKITQRWIDHAKRLLEKS